MSVIESRCLLGIISSFIFMSCGGTTPGAFSAREPRIRFVLHEFVPDSGRTLSVQDSVWSQNTHRDSVLVLVSGADGMVLPVVSIDVVAKEQFEGDALRNETAVEQ